MDLSGIEGLSESQIAAIAAAHNADVEGLKTKNTQLMDETKTAKGLAGEKDAAIEEARKVAADAEARALESQGKYEEAQKLREDERAKLVAEANTERDNAKASLDKMHLNAAKSVVLGKVVDELQPAASAMLETCTSVVYDAEGNAKTVFKYGDKEFDSASDFVNGVIEDATWKRLLKGADSSGAGTKQSTITGASSGNDAVGDNLAARLKKQGLIT